MPEVVVFIGYSFFVVQPIKNTFYAKICLHIENYLFNIEQKYLNLIVNSQNFFENLLFWLSTV